MNLNSNKPILLVEDNEDDVFLMRRAMKTAGMKNPLFVAGGCAQRLHAQSELLPQRPVCRH